MPHGHAATLRRAVPSFLRLAFGCPASLGKIPSPFAAAVLLYFEKSPHPKLLVDFPKTSVSLSPRRHFPAAATVKTEQRRWQNGKPCLLASCPCVPRAAARRQRVVSCSNAEPVTSARIAAKCARKSIGNSSRAATREPAGNPSRRRDTMLFASTPTRTSS